MPLKSGPSQASFDSNVSELIRSGRPRSQALAIAYSEQRKSKPKRKEPPKTNA